MTDLAQIDTFIAAWRDTGGSELANTQSFINGLCQLLGVDAPAGSRTDDAHNDYVFERRVFQDNGDGTQSFGRVDCYKRNSFILEAKQGSEAERDAAKHRVFQFLPKSTLPDNMLVRIAAKDAFALGILSSKISVTWALQMGGTLEDRPHYNKTHLSPSPPMSPNHSKTISVPRLRRWMPCAKMCWRSTRT